MFAYNPKPLNSHNNHNNNDNIKESQDHPIISVDQQALSLSQAKQLHARIVHLGLSGRGKPIAHLLSILSLSSKPAATIRLLRYCLSLYNTFAHPPSVFVTNNLIRCFANSPFPTESVSLYSSLLRGFDKRPNKYTFTFVLHGCSKSLGCFEGVQIHAHVVKFGFGFDVFVRNALMGFYSRCFGVEGLRRVFDESLESRDLVTWNTMLAGLVRDGMLGFAEKVFDEMPLRDVISWSTMIMGYVENERHETALARFQEAVGKGLAPNEAMLVSALGAAAQLGLLDHGEMVRGILDSTGFPMSGPVGTALVDMYAKCGCIDRARSLFVAMPRKDVWTWNAMICGLATHGLGSETLSLFEKFVGQGFLPSNVTFVGVLSACSKAGLVTEGRCYFNLMTEIYGLKPEMEHYGCMVDLLGRAGLVNEAVEIVENMELKPDPVLWATLLGACRIHGHIELGEKIGNKLIELDPSHGGHYVQLSIVYAKSRKWEQVVRVRRLMVERDIDKTVGWSLIEWRGRVHKFVAGCRDHEQFSEIQKMLDEISIRLVAFGYSADVSMVLHDVGEEEKEVAIREHSERLAIAFGLTVTGAGECIRIVKNLRVCEDCHAVTKIISEVFEREIIVRDGARFHHFKHGSCSCHDFW